MTTPKDRPILFSAPMVRAILAREKTQTRRVIKGPIEYLGGRGGEADLSVWGWAFDGRNGHGYEVLARGMDERFNGGAISLRCPYGEPGDRLYVKEQTWIWCERRVKGTTPTGRPKLLFVPVGRHVRYAATDPKPTERIDDDPTHGWRVKVARFMPRWASRLTLDVTEIRAERVQDASDADIAAEGVTAASVRALWDGATRAKRQQALSSAPEGAPRPLLFSYDKGADVADAFAAPREHWRIAWTLINGLDSWNANDPVWVVGYTASKDAP